MSTIEEIQSVLKPFEEADENDQESSRQKVKPRFDRPNNGSNPRGRGNNPCNKDGHKHDWKDCSDNKHGNKHHESYQQDMQRDSSQERTILFEEHETNMIEDKDWYLENKDDFQDISDLETPYDSDFEGEDDSDDEESVTETHLL